MPLAFVWANHPNFGKFSHILDFFSNLHIRNENVELVPIAFEPHCEYSPKKHFQVGTFA